MTRTNLRGNDPVEIQPDYDYPAGSILPGLLDAASSILLMLALWIAPTFLLCYAWYRSGGDAWYEYMILSVAGALFGGWLARALLVRPRTRRGKWKV